LNGPMETHPPRTPIAQVPADDGALDRALADVDAKLTAWLAAVQGALRSGPDQAADATIEQVASAAEELCAAEPMPAASGPVAEADASDEASPAESHMVEAGPPADAPPSTAEAAPPALSAAEVVSEPPLADAPASPDVSLDETAEAAPSEQPESTDAEVDEEQLLASLDEQTQAAIRIRRRLSGHRRSVRELLEEIRQMDSVRETPKPRSKRWWRR
jgi:hypothetical protein